MGEGLVQIIFQEDMQIASGYMKKVLSHTDHSVVQSLSCVQPFLTSRTVFSSLISSENRCWDRTLIWLY